MAPPSPTLSLLVSTVVVVVCTVISSTSGEDVCIQGKNCHLPDCFCPTFHHFMAPQEIPQIVYFGFDDAVTPEVASYFRQLFTADRLNPNGCPITMSLYVSDRDTKYGIVSELYRENNEVAVHSVTHDMIKSPERLREEASQQRDNLAREANIPIQNIVGWRSPDLITAGDKQPTVLQDLRFTYDISLPYEQDLNVSWPFTLDYGYPYSCSVVPCPGKHAVHKGFWEVPINTLFNPLTNIPCTYVDGCRPKGVKNSYDFLMYNFNRSYKHTRAPFGLNMHAAWFYFNNDFAATKMFLDTLTRDYPDVYILSVAQMLEWMRNPQTISASKSFAPWDCPWTKAERAKMAEGAGRVEEPPKPIEDLSRFVDPRISLSSSQRWALKYNTLEASLKNAEPETKSEVQKPTEDLTAWVDPRISLSSSQKLALKHNTLQAKPQNTYYEENESVAVEPIEDLTPWVDTRISLSSSQKWALKHNKLEGLSQKSNLLKKSFMKSLLFNEERGRN